ncbi:MAG: triose-phosphate isomerase [Phycisphaerae bacterium]|nr:triose-phosphate isomerase [Phycisphaerae bacterium]
MRRPLVAGNWKMNLNLAWGLDLVAAIRAGLDAAEVGERVEVAVCPPAVYLYPLADALRGSSIRLGAQDIYHEPEGAFTGELSGAMIAETGAKYVIIGHSERRHTIGHLEDDWMINLKLKAARRTGLTPILCVGETLAERKAGKTFEVLMFQLTAGLVGVTLKTADDLVIAYEPVWAIGTGQNATPEQAQEAHAQLRTRLRELVGPVADTVRILYGGSMKPENAGELLKQPDVDGGLVGGASLKADSFVGIVRAALATGV